MTKSLTVIAITILCMVILAVEAYQKGDKAEGAAVAFIAATLTGIFITILIVWKKG